MDNAERRSLRSTVGALDYTLTNSDADPDLLEQLGQLLRDIETGEHAELLRRASVLADRAKRAAGPKGSKPFERAGAVRAAVYNLENEISKFD